MDKIVFKEIGGLLSDIEEGNFPVTVAGSNSKSRNWVIFYANINYPLAFCASNVKIFDYDYKQFVNDMCQKGIKYFLWEEKHWPGDAFDPLSAPIQKKIDILGQWHHKSTGKLILFKYKEFHQ
jgi:hypothetical protein